MTSERGILIKKNMLLRTPIRTLNETWGVSVRFPWSEPDLVPLARFGDCLIVLVAGSLAYSARFVLFGDHHPQLELYALVIGVLIAAQVFHLFGLYGQRARFSLRRGMSRVLTAWTVVVLLLLALAFLTQTAQAVSRLWVLLWFAYGLVGLVAGRFFSRDRSSAGSSWGTSRATSPLSELASLDSA